MSASSLQGILLERNSPSDGALSKTLSLVKFAITTCVPSQDVRTPMAFTVERTMCIGTPKSCNSLDASRSYL
jgi:hypothetical protein